MNDPVLARAELAEANSILDECGVALGNGFGGAGLPWRIREYLNTLAAREDAQRNGAKHALTAVEAQCAALQRENAILTLAVPLEDELHDRITELLKYLAMEDGFTLGGIARCLNECLRRMAADWIEVGQSRRQCAALQKEVDVLVNGCIIEIAVRNKSRSVSDYMDHWEGRALKAETELIAEREARQALQTAICQLPRFGLHLREYDCRGGQFGEEQWTRTELVEERHSEGLWVKWADLDAALHASAPPRVT